MPLPDAPDALHDLLLTPMRVVLLGDAVVGVTDRTAGTPPVWVPGALRGAFAAWDLDGEVGVLSAGRSLVQWCVGGAGARPLVLDATPQGRAVTNPRRVGRPRFVWTTATDGTRVFRHDLRTGERTAHDLGPRRCTGPLAFAPDPARRHHEDGGWLVGLAHDDRTDGADLVVLDAGELGRPAITTARIPQRLPEGRRSTWVPSK